MSARHTSLSLSVAVVLSLGLAGAAAAAEPAPLFGSPAASLARSVGSDSAYRAVQAERAAVRVDLVRADTAQITETQDELLLNLAPGVVLKAHKLEAERKADGVVIWQGLVGDPNKQLKRINSFTGAELIDDPEESAIIVRNGDKIAGTVRSGGKLYRIDPLKHGGHTVSLIDESRLPPDHPASGYRAKPVVPFLNDPNFDEAAFNQKAPYTVRVMVVYTQAAANAVGDTLAKANLAITESNQSFANSAVNVRFQLAGQYTSSYVSAGFDSDLSRFRGTSDGYLDSYHTTRNTITADVNVLIITDNAYCGLGYLNSNAASAFSVVSHSCMTGYYSFAHEIGHNFGAHHDPNSGTNTVYPYGHGYWAPNKTWRTIMAYNCGSNCPRLKYWSNPNITYNGVPMGTAAKSNNARVLNERAATVAAFR
ncbi:zinc-dependent metalloprotease [Lysobacter sp. BMK333-48F3]|uniref:M12 family metallo-peptidase n=1 Tax=Lysobacter sp. BMK333-48F3 TaxID=2867962 RepID=UPI001C8BC60D|nr:M12 family metallo-peptidase [Lysobacter sp. BMK333-48F3]MBX9399920.1 zinc-dependent metalloprotease [Lysobacter sp. BMK333-48F3]